MIVAIVGPTASGKSDLALDLAEQLAGEIVSADAFQLYRGMDIGTAKTPLWQRRGIQHHQLDVLDITETASVASYQRDARADLKAIAARGNVPIVAGGSGLYVRALLDDFSFPPTSPAVRAELEARAQQEGTGLLHAQLARLDPISAAHIDPRNTRRVTRALEAVLVSGKPYSATLPVRTYVAPTIQFGIAWEREVLAERITKRTHAMVAAGLFSEVDGLIGQGLVRQSTAGRAVGYAEVLDVRAGLLSEDACVEAICGNTRKLVSRQLQWFAKDERVHWLDAAADRQTQIATMIEQISLLQEAE